MKRVIYLIAMMFLALNLSSCGGNEENLSGDSYVRVTIGDDTWEATNYTSVLSHITNLEGQRYDITAYNENYKIVLAVAESRMSDCVTVKEYTRAGPNLDEALIWFYYGLGNNSYANVHNDKQDVFDDLEESDVVIRITSCSGGKISGEFSGTFYNGTALPGIEVPEQVVISGEFKNLPFTKQEIIR